MAALLCRASSARVARLPVAALRANIAAAAACMSGSGACKKGKFCARGGGNTPPVRAAVSAASRQRVFSAAAQAVVGGEKDPSSAVPQPADAHLLQGILSGMLAQYWDSTPTAEAAVGALEAFCPDALIAFDHVAFRTFGMEGLGIASVAQLFTDFGYQRRDALDFPAKKLRAYWYSPPDPDLPRIFISELKVEELSAAAQEVVQRYAGSPPAASLLGKYGLMSSLLGVQPWGTPTVQDFELLAQESEYAAWVLVNGYALNHTTISVHRLAGLEGGLEGLNAFLQEQGFALNDSGGLIKVSPDGGLLQSSTVADRVAYCFAGGEERMVPGAYIEFAERKVLPQFASLKAEEVEERHRRDGFEAASADRIFESTSLAAKSDGV